jgi:glycosyltransferase involved in cell wall biosynthesis
VTLVSIIVPCRNEERYIAACLSSVLAFTVPAGVEVEVFVMDGMSSDLTPRIVRRFAAADRRVRLRQNPGRLQSTALNLALREARGQWIMRLDAHSSYPPDYLIRCLETAERTGADNVGGVFDTQPGGASYQAAVVQALTTHRFGVGNAGYRLGEGEGPADTVPYGFFRREIFDRIGGFDERLVRAQDYELNRRIVRHGGTVWRNPAIRVIYHNVPTLRRFYQKQITLEAPYNVYMWYVAPYAFAWRHAITGAFVAGVVGGGALAARVPPLRAPYRGVLSLYATLAVAASVQQALRYREPRHLACLPACFAGFHLSHGAGILAGLARLATRTSPVQARAARPPAAASKATSRIRHLTSVHVVADTRILHKECKWLARAGHDVALIACHDREETIEGVRVIPVARPRNRLDRMTRVTWSVYRAARREQADVCHLHDPELLWIGFLLKARGRKVIYDAHEDVPKQIMNKFWIPRGAKRLLAGAASLAERVAGRAFDAIVVATPAIGEKFPPEKTVVVQNFPESAIARDGDGELPFDQRPYAFAYMGGLSDVQGVREIVAASALLPDGAGGVVGGRFLPESLAAEIGETPGWKRVRYVGQVSRPEVVAAMRSARCGVVVDHPISNYVDADSTKMFEYMACGLPVVCSDMPRWVSLMREVECGIAVDPHDPEAIAGAIRRLAERPEEARRLGDNGRKAILTRLNWESQLAKLDALYRRLAW